MRFDDCSNRLADRTIGESPGDFALIHHVTVQIPDEVYLPLLKQAGESGQTVEQVAGARLAQTIASPAPGSLLRKWIGAPPIRD